MEGSWSCAAKHLRENQWDIFPARRLGFLSPDVFCRAIVRVWITLNKSLALFLSFYFIFNVCLNPVFSGRIVCPADDVFIDQVALSIVSVDGVRWRCITRRNLLERKVSVPGLDGLFSFSFWPDVAAAVILPGYILIQLFWSSPVSLALTSAFETITGRLILPFSLFSPRFFLIWLTIGLF